MTVSTMALRDMVASYWLSQAIYVAAELGLADHMKSGPVDVDDLAQAVGAKSDPLYRVLRSLVPAGLFTEDERRRFSLTPLGEQLRSDAAVSHRAIIRLFGAEWYWRAWGQLLHSVRTGETAFEHVHGQPFFDYLRSHPGAGAVFDAAMSGGTAVRGALVEAYDFGPFRSVVDVGGGEGGVLTTILQAHPDLHGVVFEQPAPAERARARLREVGLTDRGDAVAGDFFEGVVPGGDLYLLSQILHDWEDEPSIRILRNVRRAIDPRGRLLVVERVVPPNDSPHPSKMADLNMLVVLGGRERTEEEYRRLFGTAGFELTRVVELPAGGWCLVEGRPV